MKKDIRILVVDDFATMRRIVKNLLKQTERQHETFEASEINGAIELFENKPIDLIICDWHLPEVKDLLLKVRGKVPFIAVMSMDADDNVVLDAIKCGIDQFIRKPFWAKQLDWKIRSLSI